MPHPIEIDCASVKARLDSRTPFLLLDCREVEEHETVRIDGSQLLPMSEIQQRESELQEHRAAEVVVYCHHGGRSLRVAMWLRSQGYDRAMSMAGGIDQWAQEIDPSLPRY